jgi:hypothetical protein
MIYLTFQSRKSIQYYSICQFNRGWALCARLKFFEIILRNWGGNWVISGSCWVLLGFAGFCWVIAGLLLGFPGLLLGYCWVLLGFAGFCWVRLGLVGSRWVIPTSTRYAHQLDKSYIFAFDE